MKKYYYDGRLIYEFDKRPDKRANYNNQIIMGKNDNTFTAIIISDTHKGGPQESSEMLDAVYNLCTMQGIHIIIHCGDFIDSFVNENATINNFMLEQARQIEQVIKSYPYDKGIFNFVCLGNHDLFALEKGNQNIALIFESVRHDLVPIGWNLGTIKVKSDEILVGHKINKKLPYEKENRVILIGHRHNMGFEFNKNKIIIQVPALDCYRKPILKLILKMERGIFISGKIEQYTVENSHSFNKTNETKFEFESKTEGESRKRTL